jgi:signal transduction histidine kinase
MREGPDLDSKITSTSRFAPVGAREDREAEASGGRSHRSPRDRLADAACVGVALLLGGLFILGSLAETPPQPVQLVWELVVGGSACAALLLLRRRWPVGLALVLIVASPLSALGLGAALMAAFTVATRRSWRVSAALGGLLAAVFMSSFALAARTSYEYWSAAATVLFVLAALLASGMLVRSQRLLVRSLQERARQAEEGQQLRVQEARRLERERIAREMHDVLAHRISLLTLHAGAGPVGLAERVDLVHGQLEHGPTPDGDFQLRAWLPWPP